MRIGGYVSLTTCIHRLLDSLFATILLLSHCLRSILAQGIAVSRDQQQVAEVRRFQNVVGGHIILFLFG